MRHCVCGCGVERVEDVQTSIRREHNAGGVRIQQKASERGAEKVLIPRKLGTPWVGRAHGAMHEDWQITGMLHTLFGEG
jgi:hypothetical protein